MTRKLVVIIIVNEVDSSLPSRSPMHRNFFSYNFFKISSPVLCNARTIVEVHFGTFAVARQRQSMRGERVKKKNNRLLSQIFSFLFLTKIYLRLGIFFDYRRICRVLVFPQHTKKEKKKNSSKFVENFILNAQSNVFCARDFYSSIVRVVLGQNQPT